MEISQESVKFNTGILAPVISHRFMVLFDNICGLSDFEQSYLRDQVAKIEVDLLQRKAELYLEQPLSHDMMRMIHRLLNMRKITREDKVKADIGTLVIYHHPPADDQLDEKSMVILEKCMVTKHDIMYDYQFTTPVTHKLSIEFSNVGSKLS